MFKSLPYHSFKFVTKNLDDCFCPTEVMIDGVPLKGVTGAKVIYHAGRIPTIRLEFDAVDIDVEVKPEVKADG